MHIAVHLLLPAHALINQSIQWYCTTEAIYVLIKDNGSVVAIVSIDKVLIRVVLSHSLYLLCILGIVCSVEGDLMCLSSLMVDHYHFH